MTDTQRVAIHYTPTPYPGIPLASFWIFWLLCQNGKYVENFQRAIDFRFIEIEGKSGIFLDFLLNYFKDFLP